MGDDRTFVLDAERGAVLKAVFGRSRGAGKASELPWSRITISANFQ